MLSSTSTLACLHFNGVNRQLRSRGSTHGGVKHQPRPRKRSAETTVHDPHLELQIKSWTRPEERDGHLRYPLKARNYNSLAKLSHYPKILVLVVMPPYRGGWFCGTDEQGTIRHCAYWKSLQGEPQTGNTSEKTIYISKRDQFSVDAPSDIMERIAQGGFP
jgi:Domain of unknown function (DUF4365)